MIMRVTVTRHQRLFKLDSSIKALPLNKAPSYDNITYEHIIYGGTSVRDCLFRLFDRIIDTEIYPNTSKTGLL